ncbi:MAG: hypothetical protein WCA38_04650, partial [Candidatus Acidiferrales bacterium]
TQNFDAKGNSTGPKGPLTPREITKLKTDIGRGTSWDINKSDESNRILTNLRKATYAYLDSGWIRPCCKCSPSTNARQIKLKRTT